MRSIQRGFLMRSSEQVSGWPVALSLPFAYLGLASAVGFGPRPRRVGKAAASDGRRMASEIFPQSIQRTSPWPHWLVAASTLPEAAIGRSVRAPLVVAPLRFLVAAAERVARGDLRVTLSIPRNDQQGQSARLGGTVGSLSGNREPLPTGERNSVNYNEYMGRRTTETVTEAL
jgi:hypothetical protein